MVQQPGVLLLILIIVITIDASPLPMENDMAVDAVVPEVLTEEGGDGKAIVNKVDGPIDDPQDLHPNMKVSTGQNYFIGDGRHAKVKTANGALAGGHDGFSSDDAYVGPKGHLFLGPSRRRVGAGFGRRRRADAGGKTPDPVIDERVKKCLEKDLGENVQVKGLVRDVGQNGAGVAGMTVTFLDAVSTAKHSTTTDANGHYELTLKRCATYTIEHSKKGYIDESGAGTCGDPYLLEEAKEFFTSGVSGNMMDTELRATLTWKEVTGGDQKHNNGDPFTKDLDLHMLIPGKRRIFLPGYEHLENASPEKKEEVTKEAEEIVDDGIPLSEVLSNGTRVFVASNMGAHPDDAEVTQEGGWEDYNNKLAGGKKHHIYWDGLGSKESFPYTTYEFDAGVDQCITDCNGDGPEAIHVHQTMEKQYLLYVTCYSCDHNKWGGEIPLTKQALHDFQKTEATVRVYQGKEQIYCRSISAARGAPHNRWDTVVLKCPKYEGAPVQDDTVKIDVHGGGSKEEAVLDSIQKHRCATHDINAWDAGAPTVPGIESTWPAPISTEAKTEVNMTDIDVSIRTRPAGSGEPFSTHQYESGWIVYETKDEDQNA